ncbi:hypothetical protein N8T08_008217 [Aspergillus melleus]|uniref:Uncharacterized protein n=1 Tax=Aspergillus melleus TaxID=138277 RepID=A0ACC3AW04_9EURO|nr:hypothetical protein N8T08_008217 [Aspergillus melleus]
MRCPTADQLRFNPGKNIDTTGYLSRAGQGLASEAQTLPSDHPQIFEGLDLASEGASAYEGMVGGRDAVPIVLYLDEIERILGYLDTN